MQTGNLIAFDRYTWRVLALEKDAALLMTEEIVGQQPYHDRPGDVSWAGCALRKYLNGPFFDAFREESRARIRAVTNKTPDNPWYGAAGGEDTRDYIFLLSIDEAVRQYFGDSGKNLDNRSPKQRYWFQKKDENNVRRQAVCEGKSWWW